METQYNFQSRRILCCLGALALLLAAGLCLALPTDSDIPDIGVPQTDGNVLAIAAGADRIYVGGQFSTIGGVARNNLAAINPATGEVDAAWNPNVNNSVYAIAVDEAGGKVYVGGAFTTAKNGANARAYVAAFNTANSSDTGAPDTTWEFQLNGPVRALAIGANNKVYAGGEFTQVVSESATRNRLAAFTKADGVNEAELDIWDPNINGNVLALKIVGSKIYVGGQFAAVMNGAVTRWNLAAFNLADGSSVAQVDTAWDPNITGGAGGSALLAIEYVDSHIIVGGMFTTVLSGTSRSNIAVFTPADGSSAAALHSTWDLNFDDLVKTIAADESNGTVYLGGNFQWTFVSGTGYPMYPRLVAVASPASSNPGHFMNSWKPLPDARVMALALDPSSGGLLAGGYFTTIKGVSRGHLAGFGTAMTTRYVTNTNDSGPGSLRQTIADADNLETIEFLPSLAGQTIALASGEIVIDNKAVLIQGLGMNDLTISGGYLSRVFRVTESGTLAIGDLAVAHGRRQLLDGSVAEGGGIRNAGYLELYRVDLHHCTAAGASGTASGTPHARGGGIWSSGQLFITESRVRDNLADGGTLYVFPDNLNGYDGEGGGIYNTGSLDILRSEISFNTARGFSGDGTGTVSARGGGIYDSSDLSLMTNSTLSGNQTLSGMGGVSLGGGLYAISTPRLRYCTVAFNSSTGSSASKRGAGVYSVDAINGPTIEKSIFANNTGPVATDGPDLYGNFVSQDYNLIRVTGGFALTGTLTNNILGRNPLLLPLQDNGGFTYTHGLRYTSPARNAIPVGQVDTNRDQRRQPRPYPTDGAGDIGAFEDQGEVALVQRIVTNTNDSGAGSLRQILFECDEGDEVIFDASLNLQTITLTSGELVVSVDLTITGLGMNNLTISGNDASRVFNIAAGRAVVITDLSIADGRNTQGGGIFNSGNLTLERLHIHDCLAPGSGGSGLGGGIYNDTGARLDAVDCRICHNTARGGFVDVGGMINRYPGMGGGIYNKGPLTMSGCELSENSAENGIGISGDMGAYGGGLYTSNSNSVLTNCTISGNTATGYWPAQGGGIHGYTGLRLVFCTVTDNTVAAGSGAPQGGGIYSSGIPGIYLHSSIIAGNSGATGTDGADLFGSFINNETNDYNLYGTSEGYTVGGFPTLHNITGRDPRLGPLQDNGGPTWTHALLGGSLALDWIPASALGGVTNDQRGQARPSPATGKADIGAYEHQSSPVQRIVTNNNDSGAGSLRQILSDCYPGDSVIFDAGLNGQTIALTSGELVVGVDLTITGLGMNNLTVSGNDASRVFTIAAACTVVVTDLSITDGKSTQGGGIFNSGNLTIERLHIHDSLAQGSGGSGLGGAIYSDTGARLDAVDCRICQNTAIGGFVDVGGMIHRYPGMGGGIYNKGPLTMSGCELSDNSAENGIGISGDMGAYGGGLYTTSSNSVLTNCTISGNTSTGYSPAQGGGIHGYTGLRLVFCTVTNNTVAVSSGAPQGGGIYSSGIPGIYLHGSIIAGNSGATGADGADLFGSFINNETNDYNLYGTSEGYTVGGFPTLHNITGQNPLLGPLQDNGGPTWTHALLGGSLALDWIPASALGGVTNDQRGEPRPSPATGNADIGAHEHQRNPIQRTVMNNNDSGAGSLRQILTDCYSGDSVIFDAGLNGQTITLTTGELLIKTDVTITGLGMNALTISGNNASRIFNIAEGNAVEISDLTVTNGQGPSWDPSGGGIYNSGSLFLDGVFVRDCLSHASGKQGKGGGIFNDGTLVMLDCRVRGNTAEGDSLFSPGGDEYATAGLGGGIFNLGLMALSNCEISGNTAKSLPIGWVINQAEAKGGGMYDDNTGWTVIENSTFSGNNTNGDVAEGAGIYATQNFVSLTFCTIAFNEARGDGTKTGGGIHSTAAAGQGPLLINSIIANNTGPAPADGPDLYGNFVSGNYNLFSTELLGFTLSGSTGWNINGYDPRLGPLQDNGGPTLTHALLDGSPALNWIPASEIGTITTDQRGQPRPSPSDGNADIGAYEHRVTPSGPTWTNLTTYSNFLDTANAQPMWDSFKLDVYSLGQPGSLTLQKTATRLSITTIMDQGLSWPYGQWSPPGVNEVTLDAAGKDKLYQFKVNMGTNNASVSLNPMIRLSLNGRTQGPGEASREFTRSAGENGPTSAALTPYSVYSWPSATGTFAPTFLVFDDDSGRGGTIYIEANATLNSIAKAQFTGGAVTVDQGQGASAGFVSGTGNGQWAIQAVPFTGVYGYTGSPTFTSSITSNLMTLGVSGTVSDGQSGLVKYGSAGFFTTQADKLYVIKVRVAASTNDGRVPGLRIFASRGNAVAYLLQSRNNDQNSGPTTTPKDFVCVFETDAKNAGLWDLGMEVIAEPGQAGNLQISRITVEEYAKPTE